MHRSTQSIEVKYNPELLTIEQLDNIARAEHFGVEVEKSQQTAWVPSAATQSTHMMDFWSSVKPGIVSITNHAIGGEYLNLISDYAVQEEPEGLFVHLEDGYHVYLTIKDI